MLFFRSFVICHERATVWLFHVGANQYYCVSHLSSRRSDCGLTLQVYCLKDKPNMRAVAKGDTPEVDGSTSVIRTNLVTKLYWFTNNTFPRPDFRMEQVQRECPRQLLEFVDCVEAAPHSWQTLCDKQVRGSADSDRREWEVASSRIEDLFSAKNTHPCTYSSITNPFSHWCVSAFSSLPSSSLSLSPLPRFSPSLSRARCFFWLPSPLPWSLVLSLSNTLALSLRVSLSPLSRMLLPSPHTEAKPCSVFAKHRYRSRSPRGLRVYVCARKLCF